MIKVENLKKIYHTQKNTVIASDNINFEFQDNKLYFILGKSGCGKTTFLNILSGLDSYQSGHIYIDNEDISKFNEDSLNTYRNINIGIIFQDYNLIYDMNVFDNLRIAIEIQQRNIAKRDYKSYLKEKIHETLHNVGLDGYENRKINELSGGERQRVAIARTLLKEPDIIFADEPTGNLDKKNSDSVLALFREISKDHLIIIVSHDKESAYKYGDVVISMEDGSIREVVNNKPTQQTYSFTIKYKNSNETFENLNRDEIYKIIDTYFNDNSSVTFSDIRKEEIKKDEQEESQLFKQNKPDKALTPKKLSYMFKARLSLLFLRKKILRLILTTLMLSLTIVLLFLSLYTSFYDKNEIITDYLETYNPNLLPIHINSEYKNDLLIKQEVSYSKGEELIKDINNNLSDFCGISKAIYETELFFGDNDFYDATIIFINNTSNINIAIGTAPTNKNEIALSDYVADELNVSIGDTVLLGADTLIVSGIVTTDYKEYNLKSKLSYGYTGDFFEYYCLYKYYACYVSEEYYPVFYSYRNELKLRASNFFCSDNISRYVDTEVSYGDVDELSSDALLYGRLPENENEVVISLSFAIENTSLAQDETTDDDITTDKINYNEELSNKTIYNYHNLHDKKYNGYYNQYLNIYDFLNDGITIVGIVNDEDIDSNCDVYIQNELWETLKEQYYTYYYADILLEITSKDYASFIEKISNQNIIIDEPAINSIDNFSSVLSNLKILLYVLLFVTAFLNFFMIGTFINISISENTKSIGILRALGVTSQDCSHIFSIEFYSMYILSVSISYIVINFIINLSNKVYISDNAERIYDIAKINIPILIFVIIIELLINIISARIPINRICKRKPIEIIRGN